MALVEQKLVEQKRRTGNHAQPVPRLGLEVELEIATLRIGWRPRTREHASQVARLREILDVAPPILVRRDTHEVIDGVHRILAAKAIGWTRIGVVYFDGNEEEAAAEAVRRNASHGMPLSLQERRRAATHFLIRWPHWSDRRLAELCGVSPRTVAALRVRTGQSRNGVGRIGRDGRRRPLDTTAARQRVAALLQQRPNASIRDLAAESGASEGTAVDVKRRLRNGEDVVPQRRTVQRLATRAATRSTSLLDIDDLAQVLAAWVRPCLANDAAFGTGDAAVFAASFDRTALSQDDLEALRPDSVPLSRVYEVAAEARKRAAFWSHLAVALEMRACRGVSC